MAVGRGGLRPSLAAFGLSLVILALCATTFTFAVDQSEQQQQSSSSWLSRSAEERSGAIDGDASVFEAANRIVRRGRRVIPVVEVANSPYSERLVQLGGRNKLAGIRRLILSSSSLRRRQARPSPSLWTREGASESSAHLTRARVQTPRLHQALSIRRPEVPAVEPSTIPPTPPTSPPTSPPSSPSSAAEFAHVTPSLRGGFRRGLLYGIHRSPANANMVAHRTIEPVVQQPETPKSSVKLQRVSPADKPIRTRSRNRLKPSRRVDSSGKFIHARVPINLNRRRLVSSEIIPEVRTTNAPPRAAYHFRNATIPRRPSSKLASIPKLQIRRPDFGPVARGNKATESQPIPLPPPTSASIGVSNAPSFGTFGAGTGLVDQSSIAPAPSTSRPSSGRLVSFSRPRDRRPLSDRFASSESGLLPNERPVQPPPPSDFEAAGTAFGNHPQPLAPADHELLPRPEQPPRPEAGTKRVVIKGPRTRSNEEEASAPAGGEEDLSAPSNSESSAPADEEEEEDSSAPLDGSSSGAAETESSAPVDDDSSAPSVDSGAESGLLPGPGTPPASFGGGFGGGFGSGSGLKPGGGLPQKAPVDDVPAPPSSPPAGAAPSAPPAPPAPPAPAAAVPTTPPPAEEEEEEESEEEPPAESKRPPPSPEEPLPAESGLRPVRPPSEAHGPGGFGSGSGGRGGGGPAGWGQPGPGGFGGGASNGLGGESHFTGQSALTPNQAGPTGDGYNPPLIAGVAAPPPVAGVNFGGGAAGINPFVLPLPDTTVNPPTSLKPSALLNALNKVDTGFNQALNAFEEGSPLETAAIDILEVALGSEKLDSQLKLLSHVDRTVGLDNLKRLQRWANTGGALDLLQQQVVKITQNYKPDDLPDIPALNYLLSYSGKRK